MSILGHGLGVNDTAPEEWRLPLGRLTGQKRDQIQSAGRVCQPQVVHSRPRNEPLRILEVLVERSERPRILAAAERGGVSVDFAVTDPPGDESTQMRPGQALSRFRQGMTLRAIRLKAPLTPREIGAHERSNATAGSLARICEGSLHERRIGGASQNRDPWQGQ